MPDDDGYPTDDELDAVAEWTPGAGFHQLMTYVRERWAYADWGWKEEDFIADPDAPEDRRPESFCRYMISTGGWSGNEDLIAAMRDNALFWETCWYASKRGGHYEFRISPLKTAERSPAVAAPRSRGGTPGPSRGSGRGSPR